MRMRAAAAASAYCLSFVALALFSAKALPAHGSCQDIYFAVHHVEARSSIGASLPVPVIQMCAGSALPALLVVLTIAASLAWIAVLRWMPRTWVLCACAFTAIAVSTSFAYVPSTDPYAYALYGYKAAHGASPYTATDTASNGSPSNVLAALYEFFPRGSTDRIANYGPAALFEYETIAYAAGDSLHRFVILLRGANACLVIILAWLLSMLRPPGVSRSRAAWVAFHPLVLLESVAFAHGDLLMIVLLCAAFAAYRKGALSSCAMLIVAAAEVRMTAGLALLVLAVEVERRYGFSRVLRTAAAAAATLGVSAAASMIAYGSFTLGGAPALEAYSSPMMLAFDAAGVTTQHVQIGLVVQALLGLALIAFALRSKRYAFADFGALASLPILRAWYCQWILPLIAIERDRRVRAAAIAAATVAIVAEWPAMTAHSDAATWAFILMLQWLVPLGAAWVSGFEPSLRTQASPAASPST
jgi:hypothetical protein